MTEPSLSLAMVAGEKSGDLLAADVLRGLTSDSHTVVAAGIGGSAMAQQGFDNWWHIDQLSVRGYAEVLAQLPRLLRMRKALRQRIQKWRPQLFVGVDAPDFNLDLELKLRAAGQRVVHFIGPSIWAWRRERIEKIRAATDHVLLVFPFEQAIYDQAGIAATYVGHPLADQIPLQVDVMAARQHLGLKAEQPVIALLPGSRPDEIRYMAATFLATAQWLQQRDPSLQFVLPAASTALRAQLDELLAADPALQDLPLLICDGQAQHALAACDAALVASGTATLETALFRKPMVIAYKMAWLSYRIMRNKGYLPYVGLPNILAGEFLVPEFIQQQATPSALGQALLAQMEPNAQRARILARFAQMHESMRLGCAARAATVLRQMAIAVR